MKRILVTVLAVVLGAGLIYGATFAWFTDSATVQNTTFAAGTVAIEADRTITVPGDTPYYKSMVYGVDNYFQTNWDNPGRQVTGTADIYARISAHSTGANQPPDSAFYSMGLGGWLVIKLDGTLSNEDGVRVIECTGSGYHDEKAEVYVTTAATLAYGADVAAIISNNGFTSIGQLTNHGDPTGTAGLTDTKLFIDNAAYDHTITYVLIKDITPRSLGGDGFDIEHLSVAVMNENNWNPGDVSYVAYTVKNVGSIPIMLRAKLDGAWEAPLGGQNYVTIDLTNNTPAKWDDNADGYKYYNTVIQPGATVSLYLQVNFDILATNDYQGKMFSLTPTFEAIQSTHAKPGDPNGWDWNHVDFATGLGT